MIERCGAALGRALAHCSVTNTTSMEQLLERMAWELGHVVPQQFAALAIIFRRTDGSAMVGRAQPQLALPTETLLGLLVEEGGRELAYRVRDHALDSARFIDARYRSSILVRLPLPPSIEVGGEAALWIGLVSSATAGHVQDARHIGRTISEWFATYAPVLQTLAEQSTALNRAKMQLREASSIAHDARAPLGAIKLLVAENSRLDSTSQGDLPVVLAELDYLEELLSRCSPNALNAGAERQGHSELCSVIAQVVRRFGPELSQSSLSITVDTPTTPIPCCISELDCARVLTNILSNAIRHSEQGVIRIEVLEDVKAGHVQIAIKDNGPGFPKSVLDQFVARTQGNIAQETIAAAVGWGLGLTSSRQRVEQSGGTMRLLSNEQGGAIVEVTLRRLGAFSAATVGMQSKERAANSGSKLSYASNLIIIDDCPDQSASLARVLATRGVSVRSFTSVEGAMGEIVAHESWRILCDAHMPDGGAERLLRTLRQSRMRRRVGVVSGESCDDLLYSLAALGAEAFFLKPLDLNEFDLWLAPEILERAAQATQAL